MKKYFFFLMLFGLFFPICQKFSLAILYTVQNITNSNASQYIFMGPMIGQDSMFNLIISSVAALLTYFFTNVFLRWESNKNK
jgi:hypothetical protein